MADFVAVHYRESGDAISQEGHHPHADRTGSDHQCALARLRRGASAGVATDREHFRQSRRLGRERTDGMQPVRGMDELFAHRAVAMHADHLERFAAARAPSARGRRGRVVQVGLHGDELAWREESPVGAGCSVALDDFGSDLVAEDARVFEERLAPAIGVDVGAADAEPAQPQPRLARTVDRAFDLPRFETAGRSKGISIMPSHSRRTCEAWKVSLCCANSTVRDVFAT